MSTDYVELLQQDEVWVDAKGQEHRLEDMDWKHRSNLIPFLRRSAKELYLASFFRASHSDLMMIEDPSDGVASAQDRLMAPFYHHPDPEDWLERTPLMRRLTELEKGIPFYKRQILAARNAAYEIATGYKKARLAPRIDP